MQNLKKEFEERGFVIIKGFLPREKVEKAGAWLKAQDQASLARSWMDQEPGVPLAVYQYIHEGNTPISEIAANPKVLEVAQELMGEPVYVWSSKVNLKAAWCGTAEYYHQDLVYWKDRGYTQSDMLSCMICVDKHGVENAGLHVIPGSHKEGFIEHKPFININGLQKFMVPPETMDKLSAKNGLEVIEAEPGDAVFFHSTLIHGSAHNISGKSRMIVLSQINTHRNKPNNVSENAKKFSLWRAQMEMNEAKKKYDLFKAKYDEQLKSEELLFNSPIPKEEREKK